MNNHLIVISAENLTASIENGDNKKVIITHNIGFSRQDLEEGVPETVKHPGYKYIVIGLGLDVGPRSEKIFATDPSFDHAEDPNYKSTKKRLEEALEALLPPDECKKCFLIRGSELCKGFALVRVPEETITHLSEKHGFVIEEVDSAMKARSEFLSHSPCREDLHRTTNAQKHLHPAHVPPTNGLH
jgi:hypothetical protein